MTVPNPDHVTDPSVLRTEAEAEKARAAFVAESKRNLGERCPECGALGSLEERDGTVKCIDCDVTVLAASSLGGLGRK